MPDTDYSPPTTATAAAAAAASSYARSIFSLRRGADHHQVQSVMDGSGSASSSPADSRHEMERESFQRHVTERFSDLASSSSSSDEYQLLSLPWIWKLLDSYLSCQEEFHAICFSNNSVIYRPPLQRMVNEFFDRSVKALDVCNAVRAGIEQIREWKKILDIVLCALDCNNSSNNGQKLIGEGQFRRARKAVLDLTISMMLDEKASTAGIAHRNRSFGRHHRQARDHQHNRTLGHFRSLSWSVSPSWSAARQLQAIGNNLVPPKGNEIVATGGIALAVYTMSSVLLFVMWVLVAAIPCQDRGLHNNFSIPRNFPWAAPLMLLHERVLEESKRRERRSACGLLREIYRMEKCARAIGELADSVQLPLTEEREGEVREKVVELRRVYEGLDEGLDPLERQVREVFHRIVHSRTEGLDSTGRSNHND